MLDWEQIQSADANFITNDEDEAEKYFNILLQVINAKSIIIINNSSSSFRSSFLTHKRNFFNQRSSVEK